MNRSPLLHVATGTRLSCFLSLDNLDLVQYLVTGQILFMIVNPVVPS